MKKYTNITNAMSRVEFEDHVQFLRRGQSVTNDLKTVKVPKGILVEDVTPTKPAEKKPTKVKEIKAKSTKSIETKAKGTKKPK